MKIENLPDWVKYVGMVVLIFVIPSLLNILAQEYNGYLYQTGDWSFVGLPTVVFLWWGVLILWLRDYSYRKRVSQVLDTILTLEDKELFDLVRKSKESPSSSWSEESKAASSRRELFETAYKRGKE